MWLHCRRRWAPGYPMSSHTLLSGLPTTKAVMVPSSDSRPSPGTQGGGRGKRGCILGILNLKRQEGPLQSIANFPGATEASRLPACCAQTPSLGWAPTFTLLTQTFPCHASL